MTQKGKAWTKYSKPMAATIIQRKYRRHQAKKKGIDIMMNTEAISANSKRRDSAER